jgi:hypothetical protein
MVQATKDKKADKILIIAKNHTTAIAAEKAFKHNSCRLVSTHLGNPETKRRFLAVLVFAESQEDLDKMSATLVRYQNCPVVAFCGSALGLKPPAEFTQGKVLAANEVHSFI